MFLHAKTTNALRFNEDSPLEISKNATHASSQLEKPFLMRIRTSVTPIKPHMIRQKVFPCPTFLLRKAPHFRQSIIDR